MCQNQFLNKILYHFGSGKWMFSTTNVNKIAAVKCVAYTNDLIGIPSAIERK